MDKPTHGKPPEFMIMVFPLPVKYVTFLTIYAKSLEIS